ncbi:MAG: hypothetical protein WCC92_19975 [Candidatus Korobacteraceae bacterium]
MQQQPGPKLYSYVVQHDNGQAPNPYFGLCTLCLCKFRKSLKKPRNVVELAKKGDWIFGTGGADLRKSAGPGKLVYAMRVTAEPITRGEYYASPQFAEKKPLKNGSYEQSRGDNKRPRNHFEEHDQFVLISNHFYYFGRKALVIPKRFDIEKTGPDFRSDFEPEDISKFVRWVEKNRKLGKNGEPCYRELDESKGRGKCKSSC